MDYAKPSRSLHICQSSDCDCGMTRRDFLRLSALTAASVAAPLLSAGDALAQGSGSDVPVKIGYLPITDAAPLLVAHARKLFEAEGPAHRKAAPVPQLGPGRRGLRGRSGERHPPALAGHPVGALRHPLPGQGGGLEPRQRLGPDRGARHQQRGRAGRQDGGGAFLVFDPQRDPAAAAAGQRAGAR
jgi:hypothetical protein